MVQRPSSRPKPSCMAAFLLVDHLGVIQHAEPGVRGLLGVDPELCRGNELERFFPQSGLQLVLRDVLEKGGRQLVELSVDTHQITAALAPVSGTSWVSVVLAPTGGESGALHLRATIELVISGFAHEVRNPISAILSLTEASLAHLDPEGNAAGMLSRIPALVNRVDKLIKQALYYSRPRQPLRCPEQLGPLLNWAVDLSQIRQAPIELRVDIEEGLGAVQIDAEQIEQVLVNMLCNARDAARSWVSLTARRKPNRRSAEVVIEVSDDGGGIENHHRPRIFDPFFSTKANGTGLGLAIARDLARLNGGDLVLASTSKSGSSFHLYLVEATSTAQAHGVRGREAFR